MITYPVPPASRWSIFDLSTQQIVARNVAWPRADGGPIEGLDPRLVYLLQSADTPPSFDSRLCQCVSADHIDVEANTIHRTWSVAKLSAAEQLRAVDAMEAEMLTRHGRLEQEVIETRLMVAAILTHLSGVPFPPKVQAMVERYKARGAKIAKNRDRASDIAADIASGRDPDLGTGWET